MCQTCGKIRNWRQESKVECLLLECHSGWTFLRSKFLFYLRTNLALFVFVAKLSLSLLLSLLSEMFTNHLGVKRMLFLVFKLRAVITSSYLMPRNLEGIIQSCCWIRRKLVCDTNLFSSHSTVRQHVTVPCVRLIWRSSFCGRLLFPVNTARWCSNSCYDAACTIDPVSVSTPTPRLKAETSEINDPTW